MLQEWDHHANQHENLITQSKINEKDLDIQAHRANLKFCRDRLFYSLHKPEKAKYYIDERATSNKEFKDDLDKRNIAYKEDSIETRNDEKLTPAFDNHDDPQKKHIGMKCRGVGSLIESTMLLHFAAHILKKLNYCSKSFFKMNAKE
jgi:hypothetical protein